MNLSRFLLSLGTRHSPAILKSVKVNLAYFSTLFLVRVLVRLITERFPVKSGRCAVRIAISCG